MAKERGVDKQEGLAANGQDSVESDWMGNSVQRMVTGREWPTNVRELIELREHWPFCAWKEESTSIHIHTTPLPS